MAISRRPICPKCGRACVTASVYRTHLECDFLFMKSEKVFISNEDNCDDGNPSNIGQEVISGCCGAVLGKEEVEKFWRLVPDADRIRIDPEHC